MPLPDDNNPEVTEEGSLEEILASPFSTILDEVVRMHIAQPGSFLGLSYVINGKAYDIHINVVGEHLIN